MKRLFSNGTGLFCLLATLSFTNALAFRSPDAPTPADSDVRRGFAAKSAELSPVRQAALNRLKSRVTDVQIGTDEALQHPTFVMRWQGFLTGPDGAGGAIPASALLTVPTNDLHRVVKAFLDEHNGLFGHDSTTLNSATVKRDYVTAHNGLRTTVWEQQLDGIPVFESVLVAHVTKRGELVNIESHLLADPAKAADASVANRAAMQSAPLLTAALGLAIAAQTLGVTTDTTTIAPVDAVGTGAEKRQRFTAPRLAGESEAKLVWLPMNDSAMRLCWDVLLTPLERGETFRVLIDAQTGTALLRRCLTEYISAASYRVFTSDSPSPFSPGWPTPNTGQPPLTSRTLVTTSAVNTVASPNGWIDDTNNTTVGNNVDAHLDRDGNNVADTGSRPTGSPFRVFDFAEDLTQEPVTYTNAAVVQTFYWCNWMHDKLYELGFTEAAGNFQTDNFGLGGLSNDAVQADVQDGGNVNNENFTTPTDGSPGRMQVYLFTGPSPDRDGDLDAETILHEYTHGLSGRLVGGGVGISASQTRGMGEGWSDFYPLALLSAPADNPNATYAMSGYLAYQFGGLIQNYYYGIRRYPYSTDMTKNPLTFKDIDPAQASAHPGVSRSPLVGGVLSTNANEVHNMGELWCVTLWQARANLIAKYGYATGSHLILQLVTDGMKLSPVNPNFLQARDAILQADQVDNGGANLNELWAAFAKRGMGFGATSPASVTTMGVVESFDTDDLRVSPNAGFGSGGAVGGPFSPSCQNYTLTNSGTISFTWSASQTQAWVTISPTTGVLGVGQSTNVSVCINASANSLGGGIFRDSVTLSNMATGRIRTREVTLDVTPPSLYFFSLDSDPGWTRTGEWAFGKPTGGGGVSHPFPDPTGGATSTNVFGVNLAGDYSTAVGGPYYLTVGPLSFVDKASTRLQFQRWLNTDYQPFVFATIEVSTDGTTWIQIWNNGSPKITESAWGKQQYNISALADNRATVYVRWGYQVASRALAYSGWNIDDVEFLAAPAATNTPPFIAAASISPGAPNTTQDLIVAVTSFGDPDNDPVTFAYQWQDSANNVAFSNIAFTAATLPASATVAGRYYRVVVTPNDSQINGAPFTTLSVQIVIDSDSNGIVDDWEVQYFGHIGVNPNADADGDGFPNLYEFLAGTSPVDSSSALRITSIVANGPDIVVSFTTKTGELYALESNDDLAGSNWSAVVTNIPGTGSIVSVTHAGGSGADTRFYRVQLLTITSPADTDGDGLPDSWESQYFGNLSQTDSGDPDGDGFGNLQEFLAGTDPTDSSSALRITSITLNEPDVIISFTTCANRFYELQANDDLTTPNWSTVVTDIPGTGGIVSITDLDGAGFPNRFYRIRLLP